MNRVSSVLNKYCLHICQQLLQKLLSQQTPLPPYPSLTPGKLTTGNCPTYLIEQSSVLLSLQSFTALSRSATEWRASFVTCPSAPTPPSSLPSLSCHPPSYPYCILVINSTTDITTDCNLFSWNDQVHSNTSQDLMWFGLRVYTPFFKNTTLRFSQD